MRTILSSMVLALLALAAAAAQAQPGRMTGGVQYTLPEWFKPSLLHIRDEISEARAQGRHLMLFLHLDECPYCARMLDESFRQGDNHDFMRQHFDVIGINVRGAQEVEWVDGKTYTEQALARRLKVFGTPTLVFLGAEGRVALQLSGYRDPPVLRRALEYVQGRHYERSSFPAWLETRAKAQVYELRPHPLFAQRTDLKGHRKPLAVLFEDRQCAECARLHERTLQHPAARAEMKKLLFVRLDAGSGERVVTPEGTVTTPAQWAKSLGFGTSPALVLYDEGREVFRFEGHLYHFHFKEVLRYVSGGHYRRFASISQYNAARRDELARQGATIDYAE